MAKSGHSHSQTWQPVQASGFLRTATCSALSARQRSGHNFTQMSQPLHQAALISSSTTTSGCGVGAAAATAASNRRDGSARAASAQARPASNALRLIARDLARRQGVEGREPILEGIVHRRRQDAEQDGVGRAGLAELRGDGRRVERVALGDLVGDFGRRFRGVPGRRAPLAVAAGEGRHDAARVGDEDARARPEIIEPAQPLGPFERDQGVRFAHRDRRRPHLLAEAHVAEDDAAALGHAVHFALLDR